MKKILSIICVLAVMLSFAACGNKQNGTDIEISTEETVNVLENDKNIEIKVFDVVDNKEVIKKIEIENKDGVAIANAVLNEIKATNTTFNYVNIVDNKVYIDFTENSGVLHSGSAGELAVLDSLGMTFVEMLGYDNIYFSVEGEAYESGHIALDKDEPYM